MLRIGIDIGGTFTDFVLYDIGRKSITTFKLLSDNLNPAVPIIHGLTRTLGNDSAQIIHGSTVATNALLERKGSRTALITTRGFRDILQIGRQNRSDLYDWNQAPQPALIPAELRFEVDERVDSHGDVITPLNIMQIEELSTQLGLENIESIAICLLFSFLNPSHEQKIAAALREKGYFVSVSSEILPEFREYERTSTTVVNAYVSPIIDRYLSKLQNSLPNSHLQIMQSNGGMINFEEAKNNGVRCILSGPAGGIIGAQFITQQIISNDHSFLTDDEVKVITLDMGGTSTDVSLINGEPNLTTNAIVAGCPIHLPLLDIHTIGTGGGSIAYIDPGGSLRVGPQSAGANPGPACYGKGDLPTVTDANLVLGRIRPDNFLGGQMKIFPERAYAAISKLGRELSLTPVQTAYGVIEVVNIQMERALRVISVERGHDPREFSLFSYGGAGGLHAIELARHLGIPKVIISKFSSTLSAFGMLASNVIKDYVQTIMLSGIISSDLLDRYFSPIVTRGIQEVKKQGIPEDHIEIQRSLDIRYVGQSFELNIPFSNNFLEIFHETHSSTYGYSYSDKLIEIVNIRLKAIGKVPSICLYSDNDLPINKNTTEANLIPVVMKEGIEFIPLYIYEQLSSGTSFEGPALIVSTDTTILVNHMDRITVDAQQNLLIDIYLSDYAL
jgi:N-methylhydantoinase A